MSITRIKKILKSEGNYYGNDYGKTYKIVAYRPRIKNMRIRCVFLLKRININNLFCVCCL
jgi:hypothetical protein